MHCTRLLSFVPPSTLVCLMQICKLCWQLTCEWSNLKWQTNHLTGNVTLVLQTFSHTCLVFNITSLSLRKAVLPCSYLWTQIKNNSIYKHLTWLLDVCCRILRHWLVYYINRHSLFASSPAWALALCMSCIISHPFVIIQVRVTIARFALVKLHVQAQADYLNTPRSSRYPCPAPDLDVHVSHRNRTVHNNRAELDREHLCAQPRVSNEQTELISHRVANALLISASQSRTLAADVSAAHARQSRPTIDFRKRNIAVTDGGTTHTEFPTCKRQNNRLAR